MGIPAILSQVPAATPYIQYVATNGQTLFPYPFAITQDSDLVAVVNGVTLATDSGYTLTGQGNPTGGNLTFATGQTSGTIVTLFRNIAIQRISQIAQNSGFSSTVFNAEYNQIYLIMQQLQEAIGLCLQMPNTNNPAPTTTLTPGAYANKYLAFDANGNPTPALLTSSGSLTAALIAGLLQPQTAAETALGVTPVNDLYPEGTVDRYGANSVPGTTDMHGAIKTAWNVCKQKGGGVVSFLPGVTYYVNSLDSASTNIPIVNSDGSTGTQSEQIVFNFQNGSNIDFAFNGAKITCGIIFGGEFFMFDGCTNIRLLGPKITGLNVMASGVVTLGTISGGSLYTNGSYNNVPLTGGSGGGATANITVVGNAVSTVQIVYPGGSYTTSDTLSCSAANIGGTGSGFSVPVTSVTGRGPSNTVAAPNAIGVIGLTGSNTGVTVTDPYVANMFTLLHVTAGTSFTCSNIAVVGEAQIFNGEYGVALHNAGDNTVIDNLYTFGVNRPFFFYGVKNVRANIVGDSTNFGFQSVIKAYNIGTRNISVRYVNMNQPGQSGSVDRISIQTQSDPGVIATPLPVTDVDIEYHEFNMPSGNTGQGIGFQYYGGTGGLVLQSSTSVSIFNNITIRGKGGCTIYTSTALNTTCYINLDAAQFTHPGSSTDVIGNGFTPSTRLTATPTIQFGGVTTDGTLSHNSQDYYVSAGICHVYGRMTFTALGTKTGQLSVSMPFPSAAASVEAALVTAMGNTGVSSLSGPIAGNVTTGGGSTSARFLIQGATATSNLTNSNCSNTTDIQYEVRYPL